MKDYLKLLLSFLAKAMNKREDEVAALIMEGDIKEGNLKADALDILVNAETERVKKLKAPDKAALDAAEKKGHDALLAAVRQHVKETLGLDSDAALPDLITELKAKVDADIQGAAGKKGEVTEDDFKRSKVYRDLKSAQGDEIKNLTKTWQEKYDKRESEIKQKETMQYVNKAARKILDGLKPLLPEDKDKAERLVKLLLVDQLHNGFEYEVENPDTEQEKIIPKKDGKPVENNLSHVIDFKSHVEGIAKNNFSFAVADPKGAGGDPTKGKGAQPDGKDKSAKFNAYKAKMTKPADDKDWMKKHAEIENDTELKPEEKSDLVIALKTMHKAEVAAT